jgi:hypothetical protein
MPEISIPPKLEVLEKQALDLMDAQRWPEAMRLWEVHIASDDSGLSPFAPYAMCLAQLGRRDDSRKICDALQTAIDQLPEDERHRQLQLLLNVVWDHLEILDPLDTSADLDALYSK